MTLASVELLILDEAHHATGNHAYAQVGNMYQRANPTGRVLAATASPGSTLRNINEVRTNLNAHNLDLCKRTEPLLSAYDVDMNIHTHHLDLPETLLTLIAPLRTHFNDEVAHLQRQGFMPTKEYIGTNDIERAQQSASRAIQQRDVRGYDAARRVADLRRIHMLMNLMQTQGTKVAQAFLNRAEEEGRSGRKTNRMLALPVIHQLRLALNDLDELHPKAPLVASLVAEELREKPQGKVLIFTEYRDSVERLVAMLNQNDGIEADAFIGQSSRGAQKGMTQKQQLAQLNRFRSGEINVLVATSVGEEGLDVPAADLVVLYEPVPSAVRAIQRRGRTARQRAGSVHVLIAKNTRDAYVHKASERQEENMHRLMVKLVRQKQLNETFDVDARALDAFSVQVDDQITPAKAFLDGELERYPPVDEASSNSIEREVLGVFLGTKRSPRPFVQTNFDHGNNPACLPLNSKRNTNPTSNASHAHPWMQCSTQPTGKSVNSTRSTVRAPPSTSTTVRGAQHYRAIFRASAFKHDSPNSHAATFDCRKESSLSENRPGICLNRSNQDACSTSVAVCKPVHNVRCS